MKRVWSGNTELRRRLVPLDDLRAHPKNARRGVVPEIQESLRRFGQQRSILALPDGTLVAGHHVWMAAREEGWTHIAVSTSDLTDAEVEAYLLADNRLSDLGTYDDEALAALLEPLRDLDALVGTGYGSRDVTALLAELAKGQRTDDPDEAPPLPVNAKSKVGEVYELGPHRLMCGDATNPEHLDLLVGGKYDMLLTDPPYGVNYRGGAQAASHAGGKRRVRTVAGDGDTELYAASLPLLRERLRQDGAAYVWFADNRSSEVFAAVEAAGFRRRSVIIWAKQRTTGAIVAHYIPQHEPLLYLSAKNGKQSRWFGPTNESTLWEHPRPAASKLHPTQKPVALYERAIVNSSQPEERVLDPFAGSGTLVIACEQTGRTALLMELDPAYCDVIRQRYSEFVGDPLLAP